MKKSSFLVVLFLLIFFNYLKAYEIDLKNASPAGGPFKFSFQSFIDARVNKSKPVGYTRVGMSNKTEPIYLAKNFGQQCLTVFNSGAIKYDYTIQLVAVINQVTVQETHSGGWEYSTVSLSVDYYKKEGDKLRLFYRSFVKTQKENGFDITKKHASNLCDAFAVSFENLQKYLDQGNGFFSGDLVSQAALEDTSNLRGLVIYKKQLGDGVYYSSQQILKNQPQKDQWNFLSAVDTTQNEILFTDRSKLPNSNALFAFSKNNVLYVNIRKDTYHKAGVDDSTNLGFYKDLVRTRASVGAGIAAASLGALFGIAGYAAGNEIKRAAMIREMVARMYIDLETGVLDIEP